MPIHVDGVLLHAMSGTEVSRVRTDFTSCTYSQPFRRIQYNRTPSLRAMATLAIFRCRRIARCMYRRLQSASQRAAAWAASTSKKRNSVLPCLVIRPSR
jgi:hypothetical protein